VELDVRSGVAIPVMHALATETEVHVAGFLVAARLALPLKYLVYLVPSEGDAPRRLWESDSLPRFRDPATLPRNTRSSAANVSEVL